MSQRDERTERCSRCRYWRRTEIGELRQGVEDHVVSDEDNRLTIIGECRQGPPVFSDALLSLISKFDIYRDYDDAMTFKSVQVKASTFPMTWEFTWCREFQPIDSPPCADPR